MTEKEEIKALREEIAKLRERIAILEAHPTDKPYISPPSAVPPDYWRQVIEKQKEEVKSPLRVWEGDKLVYDARDFPLGTILC